MTARPIDTAPDGNEPILVWQAGDGWHVAQRSYTRPSEWLCCVGGGVLAFWPASEEIIHTNPTKWTPLPPDPTKPQADPDEIVERAARLLLATRAKGLGREVWARRVAAAIIEMAGES